MILTPLKLYAKNPERNIDRVYEIAFSRTLFGGYSLFVAWGRRTHKASYKTYFFDNEEELEKSYNRIVKKRLNSKTRLGVNYEIRKYVGSSHKLC